MTGGGDRSIPRTSAPASGPTISFARHRGVSELTLANRQRRTSGPGHGCRTVLPTPSDAQGQACVDCTTGQPGSNSRKQSPESGWRNARTYCESLLRRTPSLLLRAGLLEGGSDRGRGFRPVTSVTLENLSTRNPLPFGSRTIYFIGSDLHGPLDGL